MEPDELSPDDFEWAGMKLLSLGRRAKVGAEKAVVKHRHPDLIAGLRATHERAMRVGAQMLKEAEYIRRMDAEEARDA